MSIGGKVDVVGRSRFSPFFHAIVVAGAGISASDCGGVADVGETSEGDGGSSAGGKAAAGASAGGNSGSRPITGGRAASGGRAATGGTPQTGGSLGVEPPDPATLAQWDCTAQQLGHCFFRRTEEGPHVYRLSETCLVNPSRPRTSADCPADSWFACLPALWPRQEGTVYVNCQCIPMIDAGCTGAGYRGVVDCEPAVCDGADLICGCAQPVILR